MDPQANNQAYPPQPQAAPLSDTARKRSYIFDWVLVAVCAALAGGISVLSPAGNLLFRVGGDPLVNTDDYFAYPDLKEIIPTWASALIAVGANFIVITIAQFWVRDWRDWHHGILGTGTALSVATLFQVTIKTLIGGLRPDFLVVCKPDLSLAQGQGYGGVYYDRRVCTGDPDDIDWAMTSFPSGHSNAAWAGLLFLAFYLNGKTKLWGYSRGHGAHWKLFLVFLPIWGATLLSLTRIIDHEHNWYDILCGAIIGSMFAIASYRAYYAALLHPFYNHIPLLDNTLGPHGIPPPYDYKGRATALEPVGPPVGPAMV